jgi:hypothetical protein
MGHTIKNRNAILKNNGINTSALSGMVTQYDANLTRYKAVDKDWWDLDKSLPPTMDTSTKLGEQIDGLNKQLDELTKKDEAAIVPANAKLRELAAKADADPDEILTNLDDMVGSGNDYVTGRSGLWAQMDKIAKQKVQVLVKARDHYRTKILSITKEAADLATRCDKLEGEMKGAITKYQAELRKLDHAKVAGDLDAFVAVLKGP